ncbi:hypothetical protein AB0K05_12690 [Nonomuraea sp. NPDC049486]|uniref:golvesin C-terminal-like domain-containing protein n=1 Tax=Nonomuraea sp. NPDC049486 TaxID=3155773 RepID=UPI003432E847
MRTPLLLTALAGAVLASVLTVPAAPLTAPASAAVEKPVGSVPPDRRDELLGSGWSGSDDLAWTATGDSTGFHLLVARASEGYRWRTAATLSEGGFDTDRWIGNVCLTGSAKRAVVAYGPRQFTNSEALFQRGAFTALVDLESGRITKLGLHASLAYHSPGCGAGESAVFAQAGGKESTATRLHLVDAATGKTAAPVEVPGQATSAVPMGDAIVAVAGDGLVEVSGSGKVRPYARLEGTPSHLRPHRDGSLTFLAAHGDDLATVEHLPAGGERPKQLAKGPLTRLGLAAGADGRAYLTGRPTEVGELPGQVVQVAAGAHDEVSTGGALFLSQTGTRLGTPGSPSRVTLKARVARTGAGLDFALVPGGPRTGTGARAAEGPALQTDDPVEPCAIPRNDARRQALQPHWKQVEWAVNLAVQGALTTPRPSNWNQSGLPSWSPQGLLPPLQLKGGGRVPAQIMLGILAQESNLWQASWHALEGVTGNPLIGDYYGRRASDDGWSIRWREADCGYGVAQVTTGMRKGDQAETTQRAIALDYATNIAAGLRILQDKWNQVYDHIKINNADPAKLENWFAAVWVYNSGFQPDARFGNETGCRPSPTCTDQYGNWGLGWSNNPMNADYPPNREPFLEKSQSDAANPQRWPYPEKVMGWAAHPIVKYDFRDDSTHSGYNQAWWVTQPVRERVKPPRTLFCDSSNSCAPAAQPCLRTDFRCWWHKPATWKEHCDVECGNENMRFPTDYPEPVFALHPGEVEQKKMPVEHFRPNCDPFTTGFNGSNAVPANSLIIDDVPDTVASVRPGCGRRFTNAGSFALNFAKDGEGQERSKIDFHQVGGGLGGHFWFANTRPPSEGSYRVTGTWTLGRTLRQWARVMVHIPDHNAATQQAVYTVDTGDGRRERAVLQRVRQHRWVSLGVFDFGGVPSVSLSNLTDDGDGEQRIAWDAIAFQPLSSKPRHQIVSLGDSYASGEGASTAAQHDYYTETDSDGGGVEGVYKDPDYLWKYGNACHRSKYAWSRAGSLTDRPALSIGERHDTWDPSLEHQFHACSGAVTGNLTDEGQFREPAQLDKGYLDENTTLVTLSVGGNDARFSAILTHCISRLSLDPCKETALEEDGGVPLGESVPRQINDVVGPAVRDTLLAIHRKAPNAAIVLMGYPRLFDGDCFPRIGLPTALWLGEMAGVLDDTLRGAAAAASASTGAVVSFADPREEFAGRGVCGEPEAIHRVIADRTQGESPDEFVISQQSFHPTKEGSSVLYRNVFDQALRDINR